MKQELPPLEVNTMFELLTVSSANNTNYRYTSNSHCVQGTFMNTVVNYSAIQEQGNSSDLIRKT